MVFYRKYRPQTIEDLDSEPVKKSIIAALSSDSPAHAFLFTGPKGLGKTSTARIVAKIINCEKRKDTEPCNKCDQCISITNGSNLDVLEIDAASNRGIDEIRDLRDKIRLAPIKAKKKVYIIDEVHMLTTEAFNALLKTLEEPPAHVVFILCTTEYQKVPSTIASRCFHVSFQLATPEELARSLKRIAKSEKLDIAKEALILIAKLADGSFRDGAKILEELSLYSKNKQITSELVEEKFKVAGVTNYINDLLQSLKKKDAKEGLSAIETMAKQGIDMKYFLDQLITTLHQSLLAEITDGTKKSAFSLEEKKDLIQLFSKAHQELKYAVLPQLPLELAIVEWSIVVGHLPHVANDARQPLNNPDVQSPSSLSVRRPSSEKNIQDKTQSASSSFASGQTSSLSKNASLLEKLIMAVNLQNRSIAGVLRGCSLQSFDGKKLIIETKYKFHKEKLDNAESRALLKKVSEEITGKNVAVSIILKEKEV